MAQQEEIVLWIDRRWKNAIEKHLKDETLQEHLEDMLDALCNQLPEQEYARISREILREDRAAREAAAAQQSYAAFHVAEQGREWYFKDSTGQELLLAAASVRNYLRESDAEVFSQFVSFFPRGTPISPKEYQEMIQLRMENTGKITGVFDIDFDKRTFSAVSVMDGWKSWPMQEVSAAAGYAFGSDSDSVDKRYRTLLEHLDGKELHSESCLSAQNYSFGDEIMETDGKLNFYVQADFDVDKAFGTFVCTDENDDWLNICANYDITQEKVCDTLELNLCRADGTEETWNYPLNTAEQEVLLHKMEDYCRQQTGMALREYAQQLQEELRQEPEMQM